VHLAVASQHYCDYYIDFMMLKAVLHFAQSIENLTLLIGSIQIDGQDLRSVTLNSVRRSIGTVKQM